MTLRQQKINNTLKEVVANFLERQSNNTSLITVMSVDVSPDLKNAKVYISVLPEDKEKAALDFCKRKRSDVKNEIKKKMNLRVIPFVDILIDRGEKNRQKIEELLMEDRS